MRIWILEHEPQSPAGYLLDWANERGHEPRVLKVPGMARWPEVDADDVVVSLGSDHSVHASRELWIAQEIQFVRAVHYASVPVLGICFGGQLLSAALGGRVRRADATCANWRCIDTVEPDLIPPGPWFRWHEDVFEVPPGGTLLAEDSSVPLAFQIGPSLGLQFHPEVGRELAEAWISGGREQMTAQGHR
jgi:GMP synthase-like glutamine amidotransferase